MSKHCLSEYGLDRHLLGLESEEERVHSLAHIATCELCMRDRDEWLAAEAVPVAIPELAPSPWERFWSGSWLPVSFGTGLAAACAVALLWWTQGKQPVDTSGTLLRHVPFTQMPTRRPVVRKQGLLPLATKGEQRPEVWLERTHQGQTEKVDSGVWVEAGDEIRVWFRWVAGGHVMLLHQDQKGAFSPLWPASQNEPSAVIHQGGAQSLPNTFEVFGPPTGKELIWGCFSAKSLSFAKVRRAIEARAGTFQLQQRPGKAAVCRWLVRFVMKRDKS